MKSFSPIPCCQVGKSKSFFDFCACVPMLLEMRPTHSTSKWECLFPAWTTNAFRLKHLTSKPETCLEATKRSVRSNMHLSASFWRKNSTFCRLNAANSNSATFKFWNPQVKHLTSHIFSHTVQSKMEFRSSGSRFNIIWWNWKLQRMKSWKFSHV